MDVLSDVPELSFNFFKAKDVVRHPVVQKIVMAYEAFEEKKQQALEAEKQAAKLASKETAQAAANTSKE